MEETNNTQQNSIPAVSVISAPTTNTDEPNYAGFFWRAAAVFIDLWFYSLLTFIVLFCLSRVHFSPTINSENIENVVTSLVIVLIIACKTFLFDFCLNGKTPGRLLCNLSVTGLEGKPLIGWKRILRSFISFISSTYVLFALPIILPYTLDYKHSHPSVILFLILCWIIYLLFLSFYIFMFYSLQKQTLYDKLLGSVVKQIKKPTKKIRCIGIGLIILPFIIFVIGIYILIQAGGGIH